MSKEGPYTSFDIAFLAGVSQSTVSRALRNSPLVSEETRIKVQDIARQLNYKADRNAANLRSKTTKTLALLIFEDPTFDDSQINPFFLSILGSITRSAAVEGYDLLVSFQQLTEDWHSEYEVSHRADGIILLGYGDYISYQKKLQKLTESGAHFIIWGPTVEDQFWHSLGCDNFSGGYHATKHLINLGHRAIAFIGEANQHSPEYLLRYQGHEKALAEKGIKLNPELLQFSDNLESSGYEAATSLLNKSASFSAIFAASDLMAMGAIKALQTFGKRVPEDIAVVGFDDIVTASCINPSLTTVHQDTNKSGELLVKKLIKLINGEDIESSLVSPSLTVRESCGAALDSSPILLAPAVQHEE